jgi:membrane protease YdiL (CAAX protease family)
VAAALVTPPVYWWIHGWAEGEVAAGAGGLAAYLAEKELPRYFDRIRWLLVLLALPWLCRATGLTSRAALGLAGGREAWRLAAAWLAAGLAMVAGVAGGQLAAGTAELRPPDTAAALLAALGAALLAALLVAFFEELVFRGVVFQLAHRALPAWGSVPVAAAIFAILHFQKVPGDAWPEGIDREPVTWTSGFAVAWRSVAAMAGTADLPVLAALFLAGSILCLLYLRHGTLLAPIGLHAGWVWAAQLHRRFVGVDPAADTALWGGRNLIDGALPLGLLALLLAGMLLAFRYSAARIGGGGAGS